MTFPQWVPITLRYPDKCRVCKRLLPEGSQAFWRRGHGIRCERCAK